MGGAQRWDNLSEAQHLLAQRQASAVLGDKLATALARFQATDTIARLRLRRGDPAISEAVAELETFLVSGREFQRLMPFATLAVERAWITGERSYAALAQPAEARSRSPAASVSTDIAFWSHVLGGSAIELDELANDCAKARMPFEQAIALLQGKEGQGGLGAKGKYPFRRARRHCGGRPCASRARRT